MEPTANSVEPVISDRDRQLLVQLKQVFYPDQFITVDQIQHTIAIYHNSRWLFAQRIEGFDSVFNAHIDKALASVPEINLLQVVTNDGSTSAT